MELIPSCRSAQGQTIDYCCRFAFSPLGRQSAPVLEALLLDAFLCGTSQKSAPALKLRSQKDWPFSFDHGLNSCLKI
jgi:hypothetical protein